MRRTHSSKRLLLIRDTIVAAYDPEAIILFGSRSRGRARKQSDYDLLIIKRTMQRDVDRIRRIHRLFGIRDFALDVIVRTPSELRDRIKQGDPLYYAIMTTGTLLYEKR